MATPPNNTIGDPGLAETSVADHTAITSTTSLRSVLAHADGAVEEATESGVSTFRAPHKRRGTTSADEPVGEEAVRSAAEGKNRRNTILSRGCFHRRKSAGSVSSTSSLKDAPSDSPSQVSSLRSNKTSGTLATLNFWSRLEKKEDIWNTPEYEDVEPRFSCYELISVQLHSSWRSTKRVLLTTVRNPWILFTVLMTFAALTTVGLVTVRVLADSYESALRDDAMDKAQETGTWISRRLDEALLPLFTLSQFVQHLDTFKPMPHLIGPPGEPGSAPFMPSYPKNITHRNVSGICDNSTFTEPFNEIAKSLKEDAKMQGILVSVQLAPQAVLCLVYPLVNTEDFPDGGVLNNTGALGHDLLSDPDRTFISRATVPAKGVVIAGPLTLIQGGTPVARETFIARLPINMPGYNISLDGEDYPCYGFAVILLNWAALKKKSGINEAFEKAGMEYLLTRTDTKVDPDTGEITESVVTIARSERSDVLTKTNSESTELDTTNNMWMMTVGYEQGFKPQWEKPLQAVTVVLAFLVSTMLMVVLVVKKEFQVLLYKMMPSKIIRKLRRGETVVNRYDVATIFFSDVVGFTTLSGSMSPLEVMAMLNEMYTAFDKLVEKYAAYKVETIGDAYIVIGGGPDNCLGRKGAEKVALFALDAIECVKGLKAPNGAQVQIRVGLASGPVVAGVVGTTMPKFTLFGDTVNLASRMESTSVQMKIQCNDLTYRLLRDSPMYDFNLEERKDGDERGVFVKGKGYTHTWWITSTSPRTDPRTDKAEVTKHSDHDLNLEDFKELKEYDEEAIASNEGSAIAPNEGSECNATEPPAGNRELQKQRTVRGSNLSSQSHTGRNLGNDADNEKREGSDDSWNDHGVPR